MNHMAKTKVLQLPARAGKDLYYKAAGPWGRALGIFKGFVRQNASFH